MEPPDPATPAFAPLATIPLSHPQALLHPDACNPGMDLVALVYHDSGDEAQLAKGRRPHPADKVALWRMTGSQVWQVDVTGRVLGLAWSRDHLYLSLFVLRVVPWPALDADPASITALNAAKSTIEHRSVHTGELVKSFPVPSSLLENVTPEDWGDRTAYSSWWPMAWIEGGSKWPTPDPGSSLMLIDTLPTVTPVDPPKPAIINPFALPTPAAKVKPGSNPKLSTFPALLPATPKAQPDVLVLASPPRTTIHPTLAEGGAVRLLTGSFPIARGTPLAVPPSTLALAQRADALEKLLDTVIRGLEAGQAAFRESEKQTMIWREELETCGEQQGLPPEEAHADLFRLLMTSRSGPAVTEWLGNRMTNRTVAKWEGTLDTSFTTLQKVIVESIAPALERIVLVLDELNGWSNDLSECDLLLDRAEIARALELCRGLATLMEEIRQGAELEECAAAQWCIWLRYEMARAAASADDSPPVPSHDLKLAWSFMKNGFVHSRFRANFPHPPETEDVLPESSPSIGPETQADRGKDLDSVIRTTIARLVRGAKAPESVASPPTAAEQSTTSSRASPHVDDSERENENTYDEDHIPSSPDTMGGDRDEKPEAEEDVREPEKEPWTWTNSVLRSCRRIISTARPRYPEMEPASDVLAGLLPPMLTERVIGDVRWVVYGVEGDVIVVAHDTTTNALSAARLLSGPDTKIVQAGWFDDAELALILTLGGDRYLATTHITSLESQLSPLDIHLDHLGSRDSGQLTPTSIPTSYLSLYRTRSLGPAREKDKDDWQLALNGRTGRRTGAVVYAGEVLVWDMEEDDEDDEKGDGEGEEGGEQEYEYEGEYDEGGDRDEIEREEIGDGDAEGGEDGDAGGDEEGDEEVDEGDNQGEGHRAKARGLDDGDIDME